MSADPDIIRTLRTANPFRDLDAAWIERFAPHALRRELAGGEYVWHRGDKARHFILVERGFVAIQRVSAEGDPVLVALFGAGDTLCVVPALQDIALPADAVAIGDRVEVVVVSATPILEAAREHAEVATVLNRALLQHASSLRSKIDIVSAGAVPKRIATLLLHLAERFGRATPDGTVEIERALTREQIGQLVNARTETVIRIMSRWAKAGWIDSTAGTLRIARTDMIERIAHGPALADGDRNRGQTPISG
jgi:CRP-like cAMP-binding protein